MGFALNLLELLERLRGVNAGERGVSAVDSHVQGVGSVDGEERRAAD